MRTYHMLVTGHQLWRQATFCYHRAHILIGEMKNYRKNLQYNSVRKTSYVDGIKVLQKKTT